ncbi:MAG: ABC-F family ATP-binding cassette domain-containing protein [Verrucomicrobiales bacterium]|nr:ABC-F family ATP-binding cassette domain-containing protein [Verrucomicrobiales bacterium]
MSTLLTVHDLSLRFNEQVLLDHASLALDEGQRVGLVGRNGCGKSTFLKVLTGEQSPDTGTLTSRRDLVIGCLPQECPLESEKTVAENIREGARHVLDLIEEFESLPPDSTRHAPLEERIMALDGWGLDHRIAAAMSHLNVPDGNRRIDTLSGGERRRAALCRAIVSRPDLLILDEPTNHLDTDAIDWLAGFLDGFPGTFLVVTHDRWFLDRVTSHIVELAGGRFYTYEGNYTEYLVGKAEREAREQAAEERRQAFLRRELIWIRSGVRAQRKKVKSKVDHYFEVAAQSGPEVETEMELVIPPPAQLGNRVVELTGVGIELGGKRLFRGFDLAFEHGRRVGVAGRNGLGKTTLLRLILGQLEPTEGTVKVGTLTEFNYVDQGRLQLNEEHTVLEAVSDGTEFVLFGEQRLSLRGYLKRFLFTDERIKTQVKYLSGGERSRLLLARILKRGGNFLILDEPTNDLDLPTLRVLEEALIAFPGVVVVVSHDRWFLNRVCTDILAFEGDGRIAHSVGDFDYYLEKRARAAADQADAEREFKAALEPKTKPAARRRPRKLTWKETEELAGIEARVLEAEAEVTRIETLFANPDFHRTHGPQTNELMTELATAKQTVADLFARWEELEAIRVQAEP